MAIENDPGVRQLVDGVLDAPADAMDRLPELLAALEHEEAPVRVGAAWAVCAVAAARPDSAATIHEQLRHRSSTAADLAGQWIQRECDVTGRASSGDAGPAGESDGDEAGDASSGSVRGDRASSSASGSTGSADGGAESGTPSGTPSGSPDPATAGSGSSSAGSPGTDAGSTDADSGSGSQSSSAGRSSRPSGTDDVVQNGRFAIELDRTELDALDVVDRVATDRHSWTYEAMATVNASQEAVLVRTYRPPAGARLSTFARSFAEAVEHWAGVDDHEHVLSVYDYGRRPHPWVVVGHATETVRSVGRLPVPVALRVVEDAALALAHAHERGVTHGAIDPRSIAIDARGSRPAGRLLNFEIVDAFRAVDGALPMDSRFAAPELFDDEHGSVGRLTDVYQLGTVLYTALTGRPPYGESLVRRGGPAGEPFEPPSAVADGVPAAVDDLVETATATHKIARFESADEFARHVRRALADVGGDE